MEAVLRMYRHALLSFRALFGWLNPKVYLMVMILAPLSQLCFFCLLDKYVYRGQSLDSYVASNALLLCVMNAVFGIMTVVTSDRRSGTLQLVVASPASKIGVFLARSVFHIVDGLVTALIGLACGKLLFHMSLSLHTLSSLLLIWLVSIFSACGLGMVLGSFGLWSTSMHLWSNLLANSLLLFSGTNYARSAMPTWMIAISNVTPLARGVTLTKQIVGKGDYTHFAGLLGQELLLGLVYFTIGFIMIHRAEFLARHRGTLDLD